MAIGIVAKKFPVVLPVEHADVYVFRNTKLRVRDVWYGMEWCGVQALPAFRRAIQTPVLQCRERVHVKA